MYPSYQGTTTYGSVHRYEKMVNLFPRRNWSVRLYVQKSRDIFYYIPTTNQRHQHDGPRVRYIALLHHITIPLFCPTRARIHPPC
jgi:hypothetical protein